MASPGHDHDWLKVVIMVKGHASHPLIAKEMSFMVLSPIYHRHVGVILLGSGCMSLGCYLIKVVTISVP